MPTLIPKAGDAPTAMPSPVLENLASQADQLGAPPPDDGSPVAPQPERPPEPGNLEAIAFLLAGFRVVCSSFTGTTSLHRTLADDKVHACATVLAPVADKYGINLGAYLGGPEGAAVMVAGPILWAAWRELADELAARKRKPEALPEAPAPAPAP